MEVLTKFTVFVVVVFFFLEYGKVRNHQIGA